MCNVNTDYMCIGTLIKNNHDNVNVSSKESFLDFSGGILQVKDRSEKLQLESVCE